MRIIILIITLLLIPFAAWAQFNEASFYVTVKSVDLIWSADTYTPYEYQGRALAAQGSKVEVEAIIEVSKGDASNLKYSWFLDNIFQRTKSGYGKSIFYFYAIQRFGAYHTIKLQIFNEDRSVFKEKSIKIPVVEPEIVIYPSNGNAHFSDQTSKTSFVSAEKRFSFIAKPYFFSIKKLTDLIFEWRFPGQEPIVSSDYDADILDLTISGKEDEEILESELRVNVSNKTESRQKASQIIKLEIY
jgi:hypothetical protein